MQMYDRESHPLLASERMTRLPHYQCNGRGDSCSLPHYFVLEIAARYARGIRRLCRYERATVLAVFVYVVLGAGR